MAKHITVQQTDTETGEIVTLVALKPGRAPHPYRNGGFVQVSQEAMWELARNPVSGESMRVLMALCAILDFDNYIQFSQVELAKLLGMSQPNVNRSIGELCKRGIIIKGAKVGRSLTYRLSPTFGMKGKGSGFQKLMADVQEFAKARQLSEDELQRSELEARGQQRLAE